MSQLDELLGNLAGVRKNGSGWMARCPVPGHEDSDASLSIKEVEDGKLLWKCHGGCPQDTLSEAIGAILSPSGGKSSREVATYDYTDENGSLLSQVLRYEPKSFRQRQPDGNGDWIYSMDGVRRVPYRLPEVLDAAKTGKWIFVVEGEKDADAIKAAGYVATCSMGGSSSWKKEFARYFKGANVTLWPDKDDTGHDYARSIAKSLQGVAARIEVVESKEGKDAFDHLEVHKFPIQEVVPTELRHEADETALSEVEVKSVEWHLKPFVQVAAFHLLAGDGGVGKGSWLAHLTAQVTTGKTEHLSEPRNVLVIASEDSSELDLKPRVLAAGGDPSKVFVLKKHILLPRDIDYLEEKIEQQRKGCSTGIVIIDPIANHIGGADGDSESAVRKAINELNFVAERTGCAIFGVRHITKSGDGGLKSILGSVAWTNSPRVVLMFDRLSNGSHDTGSRALRVVKSNRGQKGKERFYKLTGIRVPGVVNDVPLVVPDGLAQVAPGVQEVVMNDPWFHV